MIKLQLGPLDSRAAQSIADRRGISVEELISLLIREECAIEITSWRDTYKKSDPPKEDIKHD